MASWDFELTISILKCRRTWNTDPQFTVVGEWRDMETLYLDHIDNAVMDAWYEAAEKGTRIGYNLWKLPARVIKPAYCMVINQRAAQALSRGNDTQALRNERFRRCTKTVRQSVLPEQSDLETNRDTGLPIGNWRRWQEGGERKTGMNVPDDSKRGIKQEKLG